MKAQRNRPLFSQVILLAASLLLLSLLLLPGCSKSPASVRQPTIPAPEPPVTTPAPSPTGKAAPDPLTVLSVIGGEIQVMKKGAAAWKKGEEGMTLDVSDKVKTAAGGKARITFFEGSTIELEGDTEISLLELGINPDKSTAVKVRQEVGKTYSRAKKLLDTADRYEVETPAAVAAVRGSLMYIDVARSGFTFVGNIEGNIVVIVLGIETKLPENTHTSIVPGQPAGNPEPGAIPAPPTTPPPTSTTPPPTTTVKPTSTTPPPTTVTPPPTPVKPPLTVKIVSLKHGDLVGRSVTVSGVVSDLSITQAVLILNNVSQKIGVTNGNFSATISLADGVNTLSVSVTRDGETAIDSVTLDPAQN